jgi:dihydrofolate reductase
MTVHVSFFIAIAENGVIGKDNAMPWRLSSDLRRLRAMTMGKPVIMGRKTWESFPKRPLPGRPNLIVTRDADYDAPGGEVFTSVDEAVARGEALAGELDVDEVVILGGAQIYQALPKFTRRPMAIRGSLSTGLTGAK